jgi:hypothetical protein
VSVNDEELLQGVAAKARAEEDDPKLAILDRLARGENVREEELAGIDPDVIAMFRPLSNEAESRIAERIAPRKSNVRKVDFRKWVPVLAAAAAVLLFFVWPRHRDGELPGYTFELSGNVAEVRAGDPTVVEAHAKVHENATLEMVLRPKEKVNGPIAVHCTLVRDGKPRAWTPKVQISNEGSVRITGPVKELFPDVQSPWEILVAIGPESALPPAGTLFTPGAGYRVVRGVVEFTP